MSKKKSMADTIKPSRRKKKTEAPDLAIEKYEEVKPLIHSSGTVENEPEPIKTKRIVAEIDEETFFLYKAWCSRNRTTIKSHIETFVRKTVYGED